jgi:hypothetical protein
MDIIRPPAYVDPSWPQLSVLWLVRLVRLAFYIFGRLHLILLILFYFISGLPYFRSLYFSIHHPLFFSRKMITDQFMEDTD